METTKSDMINLIRGYVSFCARRSAPLAALLFVGGISLAHAQQPSPPALPATMRVATRIVPPFVEKQSDKLTGFSIDLWEQIAQQMGVKTSYDVQESVPSLLSAVKNNKADIAVAAISITSDRDKQFDFSQPIFESGLQILVRDSQQKRDPLSSVRSIFTPALLQLMGVMLLLLLIPAHVIWFSERKHPSSMLDDHKYFPGIFHAAWWAVSTLATQADQMPRSAVGRIVAVIWMFTGVGFVAYFTAALTTQQTVDQLQGNIQSINDLAGKRVATATGSTSADFLRKRGISVSEVPHIEDAYKLLDADSVDAVVYDAPVLLYYAAHDGKGHAHVVGTIFRKENYGILMPQNSPYRKPINQALLKLRENGAYDEIYNDWFETK